MTRTFKRVPVSREHGTAGHRKPLQPYKRCSKKNLTKEMQSIVCKHYA